MYSTPRFSDAEDKVTNTNTIEAITLENKLIKISPSYVLTDEYKLSPDTGIIDYVLNIENIDFGLIKKQSSTIEINKRVKHIKISAGDLTLVDAEVNDDKTGFKNADDVLLSTYLPPSKSAPFGMIQTAIDGVYPLNLEVQYEISVKGENLTDEVKQNIKIYLFEKIKEKTKGKMLWLRNNVATIVCNVIENFFFVTFAFIGIFSMQDILIIALSGLNMQGLFWRL